MTNFLLNLWEPAALLAATLMEKNYSAQKQEF